MRSRSVLKHSLLIFQSSICLRNVGSLTSIGSIASVLYVRLNGVSPVEVCGVHLYAHNISDNFSAHNPFALPNLFFSCPRITLFAASACPFVCGCSTEAVVDLIPKSDTPLEYVPLKVENHFCILHYQLPCLWLKVVLQ